MKLVTRQVEVVLSDEGQAALRLTGFDFPEAVLPLLYVEDSDDLGMWVRDARDDGVHSVLIRWEFVLSLDLVPPEVKRIGVSP